MMLAVLTVSVALSLWKSIGIAAGLLLGIQLLLAPFIIADVKAYSGPPRRAFLRFTLVMFLALVVPWAVLGLLVLLFFLMAAVFAFS